jgi:hypothetical protein
MMGIILKRYIKNVNLLHQILKMGKILSSKRSERGIVFEIEVDYEEAVLLHGHYDNVHLFTEEIADYKTNISSRGKNEITKYFLIPKCLRENIDYKSPINCQKIETCDKIMFIYVVKKENFNN